MQYTTTNPLYRFMNNTLLVETSVLVEREREREREREFQI